MPTIDEAKSMARAMEVALRARNVALSHGACLDIVARQFGFRDWNVLSAQARRDEDASRRRGSQPKGWAFLAQYPDAYDHGVDDDPRGPGGRTALIRFRPTLGRRYYFEHAHAFGCYMQTASAVPFRGKQVGIRADLRCRDVTHGATVWARVDRMPGQTLAFDNLKDAAEGWLFGASPWTGRKVVLDVPADAVALQYGFFLKGEGSLWAADFRVEATDEAAHPPTAAKARQWPRDPASLVPSNLRFADVIDPSTGTS